MRRGCASRPRPHACGPVGHVTGGPATRAADAVPDGSAHAPDGRRRGELAVVAGALLVALVAVALALASLASYASVKARLDGFASDGDADVSRADFDAIVLRLRLAAALAGVVAVGMYGARRRAGGALAALLGSIPAALAALWRGLRSWVATESRVHVATLGLLVVGAALVRLDFLFQPMRYDESVTYVHYASRPWYIALSTYTAPNNHVFHSLLVHVSTALLGGAPWAIRLPAFAAGVLLVPATYLAARVFYGRQAALVAAALVAASSALVEYSTNARGYTIVALVFLLLLALAPRLCAGATPAAWLAFALLAAVGLWTVPVLLYGLGAVVVWLVVSVVRAGESRLLARRLVPALVAAALLTALLYAPVVAASGLHSLVGNQFVGSRSWGYVGGHLPHSLASVVRQWHRDLPLPLAAMLGAAFAVALVAHRRVGRVWFPPALAAVVGIVPLVAAQRVVPFERVWLFLLPLYLTTAAAGLVFVLRPLAARAGGPDALAVALALALAGGLGGNAVASRAVYRSEDTSTFRDGEDVAALLDSRLRSGDKVLVAPPADAILEYWLRRRGRDPAALLYWSDPGAARRFFVVVKTGPRDYTLAHVLADVRLRGVRLASPRVLRRYPETVVYLARRAT